MKLYRGYRTDAGWSEWGASEADVLAALIANTNAVAPLSLRSREGVFAYYEDADGIEFFVDALEMPQTPAEVVTFLNQFCGDG